MSGSGIELSLHFPRILLRLNLGNFKLNKAEKELKGTRNDEPEPAYCTRRVF